MLIPDRLVSRMEQCGETQSSLARKVGISPQMVGKLARGDAAGTTQLHKIALHLRTTIPYLTGEVDDPEEGAYIPPSSDEIAEQMGLMKVEEVDLAIGMGATYLDEPSVQSIERWIPTDWVRNFTDSPASFLTIAKPVGDSMYPTINDRDIVLIDRSKRVIDRQDAIWALVYGGLGTIKRVRAMPDGTIKLMSDNPQVREETAVDGEVFLIGRVAGVFRRT
ncbi:XRE family transcriptional regulator [Sphingobium tyrosinilyticum]|uniref:XRE family transcriptional regulator n=1 Tax=Sphingobium tyrosinilyticum TaxID=2715436 RepID=A0ABV9EWF4_9SPHN